MQISDAYAAATAFAVRAHAGQVRKGTSVPYISHPIAVSSLVLEFGGDEEQAIAGLLHDVVEDCGVDLLTIADGFGVRVASIVEGCTDGVPDELGRKPPWRQRKEAYLRHLETADPDILLVSGADKLHNARSIVSDIRAIGETVFDRFSATEEETKWYYRSLAGVFQRRLGNERIVDALGYEVQQMTDFGISGDATPL